MDSSREPLWTPRGSHTNMDTFRERVNDRHSLSLGIPPAQCVVCINQQVPCSLLPGAVAVVSGSVSPVLGGILSPFTHPSLHCLRGGTINQTLCFTD